MSIPHAVVEPATVFLISATLCALLTPLVIHMAHGRGWVARPRADRWNPRPTALMGGLAIGFAVAVSWLAHPNPTALTPILVPALLMLVVGVVDDCVYELRPHQKLIIQVCVAALMIVGGVRFSGAPDWLAVPLSLIWIVGMANAVNLMDNMDGLATGVVGIAASLLAIHAVASGSPTAPALAAIAGACVAFLAYNFNPARIFMGDCGSMFLGFALAGLAIEGSARSAPNLALALLVPVAVLFVPIFDTTLVALTRAWHGRPIMPGATDHSSHRLVALGLSERATVLVLYGVTLIFGGFSFLATGMPLPLVAATGMMMLVVFGALGLYLGFIRVYPDPVRAPAGIRVLPGMVLYKRQLVQVVADLILAGVSIVLAHFLRFEGEPPAFILNTVLRMLPLILACRVLGMAICRGYRGIWRYAGVADVMSAGAGSILGSLLIVALLALSGTLPGVSRAALITDWLLFTVLAVAARTSYLALRQIFARVPTGAGGPSVLLLGAGPETASIIDRLTDPMSPSRAQLVGILDEDPTIHGSAVNGVPVLGSLDALPTAVGSGDVVAVLGVLPGCPLGQRIIGRCAALRIPLQTDLLDSAQPSGDLVECPPAADGLSAPVK